MSAVGGSILVELCGVFALVLCEVFCVLLWCQGAAASSGSGAATGEVLRVVVYMVVWVRHVMAMFRAVWMFLLLRLLCHCVDVVMSFTCCT